jgi:lipopolysaccharide transport system ATP-binding protein
MSDIAIKVRGLGKKYYIGERMPQRTLTDSLKTAMKYPYHLTKGILTGKGMETREEFWALDDVSFDVKQGEVLGIIGRNGAGKSTLLKILSRIVAPTRGEVEMTGRVGSLLEVGTGFHPELTGRENIYFNGSLLGMTKAEVTRKFDEIVDFSGVEKFIDTPVKFYSSGMYTRLAFAVAAHLEPEILIVDEVLAVGDAEFQKKCLGKMDSIAKSGRTVLFVSHNMNAVQELCVKGVLLEEGQITYIGATDELVPFYLKNRRSELSEQSWNKDDKAAPGNDDIRMKLIALDWDKNEHGEILLTKTPIKIHFQVWNFCEDIDLNFSIVLKSALGDPIFNIWTEHKKFSKGIIASTCEIPGNFLNDGFFDLDLYVVSNAECLFVVKSALKFEVKDFRKGTAWAGNVPGVIRPVMFNFPIYQVSR